MSGQQPLSLPSPEPSPTDQPPPEAQAQSGGKARRRILSAEECLELLGKLSGLVILGVISTNQATAIQIESLLEELRSMQPRRVYNQ